MAKEEVWEVEHLETYRAAKLNWPPDLRSDPELFEATSHLTRRMQECAFYFVHRAGAAEVGDTYHDLNPGIQFQSNMRSLVQTILCNACILDRILGRSL